jgi:membrane-bound ClpP family serine protease
MAISQVREIARADMNDEYGVSVWQEKKLVNYSVGEARALAVEIGRAADEAERVAREDRAARRAESATGWMLGSDLVEEAARESK